MVYNMWALYDLKKSLRTKNLEKNNEKLKLQLISHIVYQLKGILMENNSHQVSFVRKVLVFEL